ncbi:MAG: hypothetical protein WBI40_04545 [Methylococcaceae bacterium]
MIKKRVPQSTKNREVLKEIESNFVKNVERDNLSSLTLNELATRFESIEQQAQLLQGRILLEARNRFESDTLFGQWIQESGGALCACGKQHRTRLINLAKFFENRELDKISITAAYEISAPINSDIAEQIYELARGKNLSVAEIKKQITQIKNNSNEISESIKNTKQIANQSKTVLLPITTDIKSRIISEIGDISPMKALQILDDVMNEFRLKLQNEI